MSRPPLLVIVGPTASGKTALACALAERLDAEIVSADSQQCYRGLDAGTAKPTAQEQARARHHLLDVAWPEEQLDAAGFMRLADAAIAEIAARGRRVIVAGGTGLWIRALLKGLLEAPGADAAVRERLRGEFLEKGVPGVHAELARVDPEAAARILPNDRVRIERALEVHALTGRKLSELQREHAFADQRYPSRWLRLDPPRELLVARIDARAHRLFGGASPSAPHLAEQAPILAEAQGLLSRAAQLPAAAKALKIIGYGEAAQALAAGATPQALRDAAERTAARTRQYAKRQRTWFARECEPVPWPPPIDSLCEEAKGWYEARR